jgi:hypothetical protein
MIRIAISANPFDAIAVTMPLGSVSDEPEGDAEGERFVWLESRFVDRLTALRGPARAIRT